MLLPSGCGLCGKKDGVRFCSGCKVMPYCGVEHQTADRADHKSACSRIRRCRVDMEAKEQALRDHPDDDFTHGVGRFFKILPTRPYMEARAAYGSALTFVMNAESVKMQLDTLLENLRLCRGDNMGSRDVVPGLMLRLNKDQECYDFLKWWATTGNDSQYDWGDNTLPYLDIKNANPLEPVDFFLKSFSLPHMVALTLVKVKLFFILTASQGSSHIKDSRVIDAVSRLKTSTMAKNPNVANYQDLQGEVVKVKAQIRKLYEAVNKKNKHFWPALVNPGTNLDAQPMMYSIGSTEEMQATLKWTWEAWNETFGAVGLIDAVLQGKKDAF